MKSYNASFEIRSVIVQITDRLLIDTVELRREGATTTRGGSDVTEERLLDSDDEVTMTSPAHVMPTLIILRLQA